MFKKIMALMLFSVASALGNFDGGQVGMPVLPGGEYPLEVLTKVRMSDDRSCLDKDPQFKSLSKFQRDSSVRLKSNLHKEIKDDGDECHFVMVKIHSIDNKSKKEQTSFLRGHVYLSFQDDSGILSDEQVIKKAIINQLGFRNYSEDIKSIDVNYIVGIETKRGRPLLPVCMIDVEERSDTLCVNRNKLFDGRYISRDCPSIVKPKSYRRKALAALSIAAVACAAYKCRSNI
jgi:hypothetical protein